MFDGVFKIAFLCIVIGSASIPVSFGINSNPFIVWIGNAMGSLLSAAVVIYIGNHITDEKFKTRVSKRRVGKKIVTAFDEGNEKKTTVKTRNFINNHGIRIFGLLCPIFPGVLLSTTAVFLMQLDINLFKRWMFVGVTLVSGAYVFGYWFLFVN